MDKPIAALEITSTGIKLVVGYVYHHLVYILHALESDRARLFQGQITDAEEMSHAIRELILSAEKTLGISLESVVLGLPSLDLNVVQAREETTTTDPESHVQLFDGSNCLAMLQKQKTDEEGKKVVVDVVPYQYILDKNETFTSFPLAKVSSTLAMAADVEIMDGLLVKSFSKAVTDAGLRIDKLVNVTNAAVKYICSFQKSYSEYVYLDIGAKLTTLGYAYDGRLYRAETINFGSDLISENLAKDFSISLEEAERLKCTYGISKDPSFSFEAVKGVKVSQIAASISKTLQILTDKVNAFNLTIDSSARNLFIVSGGGGDLNGLDTYLSKAFQNRILLFTPTCYGARSKRFTNCVSLIAYYAGYEIKTSPNRPVDLTLTRISGKVISDNDKGDLTRLNQNKDDNVKKAPAKDPGEEEL
ncbi:MAG: hypothetical protein LKJ88_04630 [Bacilli bacterium]|jgi:cell division protein FtsA|nr:hypothetical protein [Bacilli bacterium]